MHFANTLVCIVLYHDSVVCACTATSSMIDAFLCTWFQCQVIHDGCLHCPSPAVTRRESKSRRSPSSQLYNVSFTMDAVEEVQNLHRYFPSLNASFAVVANPVYTLFSSGLKVYKGEALILTVCIFINTCTHTPTHWLFSSHELEVASFPFRTGKLFICHFPTTTKPRLAFS